MMNNNAKTLTSMVIAILAFITVITLAFTANNDFSTTIISYPQNDTSNYSSSLQQIVEMNETLNTQIVNPLKSSNFFVNVFKSVGAIFTTLVLGLETIKTLIVLPGILQTLFENVGSNLPLGSAAAPLLWFFTSAAVIYVMMKALQAIRGTYEPA